MEKHSRIRISNPEIDQVTLDLSLVGRKFIPINRLKSSVSKKDLEGMYASSLSFVQHVDLCYLLRV